MLFFSFVFIENHTSKYDIKISLKFDYLLCVIRFYALTLLLFSRKNER